MPFFGGLTPVAIASLVNHSSMFHIYYLLAVAVVILYPGVYIVFTPAAVDTTLTTTNDVWPGRPLRS